MSWVGWLITKNSESFVLFAENSQILVKFSVIPILLIFMYPVALNLLVNNQLNSSSNSTHHCGTCVIVTHKWKNPTTISYIMCYFLGGQVNFHCTYDYLTNMFIFLLELFFKIMPLFYVPTQTFIAIHVCIISLNDEAKCKNKFLLETLLHLNNNIFFIIPFILFCSSHLIAIIEINICIHVTRNGF